MNSQETWYFTSAEGSGFTGINDSGIETFKNTPIASLVREMIQNSLDAHNDNTPHTIVEFNKFSMNIEKFPGLDAFKSALIQCLKDSTGEEDAIKIFKKALSIFDQQTIDVMRISDFNTKGLEGADTNQKETSWCRLVKGNGLANRNKGAGGSFGIGKAAIFTCSDLRTVFYASMDANHTQSTIGKTNLISFRDERFITESNEAGWTTGIGYYSNNMKKTAILSLPNFQDSFTRNGAGTDIYIMGFITSPKLRELMIYAIVSNFLVSIWKKKLIVKINIDNITDEISYDTLGDYITETVKTKNKGSKEDQREARNLENYYILLQQADPKNTKVFKLNTDEYGHAYSFSNEEATLYLMKKENANRCVMMTRDAGMTLFEQNRMPASIEFTGILMIEKGKMNEEFRKIETPAHNAWIIPDAWKDKKEYKRYDNMYKDLRRYLREKIKEAFAEECGDVIEAFGANDFLPNIADVQEGEGNKHESIIRTKDMIRQEPMKPTRLRPGGIEVDKKDPNGRPGESPGTHKKKPQKPTGKPNPLSNPKDNTFKKVEVTHMRIICTNKNEGLYQIKFIVPHNARKAQLILSIVGEQSVFKLSIKNIHIIRGNIHIDGISKNKIYFLNTKMGESIVLSVQIDFDQYCLLEADYNEIK